MLPIRSQCCFLRASPFVGDRADEIARVVDAVLK
jgi:hypothetical protein